MVTKEEEIRVCGDMLGIIGKFEVFVEAFQLDKKLNLPLETINKRIVHREEFREELLKSRVLNTRAKAIFRKINDEFEAQMVLFIAYLGKAFPKGVVS
jgi:hypothetical protein